MYQVYSLTIAPGSAVTLDVVGAGVACIDSNLDHFEIAFDDQPASRFERGFDVQPAGGFRALRLVNPQAVAALVKLAVYDGAFRDRRQLSNAPQGINPVSVQEIKDLAFCGDAFQGAVAGEYSFAGLYNPAGSGKLLAVRRYGVWSDVAIGVAIRELTVLLPTVQGVAPKSNYPPGASVAELRVGSDVSTNGYGTSANNIVSLAAAANTVEWMELSTPYIVPAGYGLVALAVTVNAKLHFIAEFLEIAGG